MDRPSRWVVRSGSLKVVLTAVSQAGRALQFASPRLLHDKDIALAAVRRAQAQKSEGSSTDQSVGLLCFLHHPHKSGHVTRFWQRSLYLCFDMSHRLLQQGSPPVEMITGTVCIMEAFQVDSLCQTSASSGKSPQALDISR